MVGFGNPKLVSFLAQIEYSISITSVVSMIWDEYVTNLQGALCSHQPLQ